MPYTEDDLRAATIEKLRVETRNIGKSSWKTLSFWIAIITAFGAIISQLYQASKSDIEYKLALVEKTQALNDKHDYETKVESLKKEQEELARRRDIIDADIAARKTQVADIEKQLTSTSEQLATAKMKLAASGQTSAGLEQAQSNLAQLQQKASDLNRSFVYLTTDDDSDAEEYTRREKMKLAVQLHKQGITEPLTIYRSNNRWCLAVGESLPDDQAQKLVNKLIHAGFSEAARSSSVGWTHLTESPKSCYIGNFTSQSGKWSLLKVEFSPSEPNNLEALKTGNYSITPKEAITIKFAPGVGNRVIGTLAKGEDARIIDVSASHPNDPAGTPVWVIIE